jgi:hypothetical protein
MCCLSGNFGLLNLGSEELKCWGWGIKQRCGLRKPYCSAENTGSPPAVPICYFIILQLLLFGFCTPTFEEQPDCRGQAAFPVEKVQGSLLREWEGF